MSTEEKISRRKLLVRGTAMALGALGGYAIGIEPRWISIEQHDLPIAGLPESLIGTTAVQLSDLHIGSRVSDSFLLSQFEYVQALNPEFVFFTGDFLDDSSKWHLEKGLRLLDQFPRGGIGNACVLGNHDFGQGHNRVARSEANTSRLIDAFNDNGLNLLRDESVELGGLKIAGLRDYWYGGFHKESASDVVLSLSSKPSIVLSHNPDTVDLPIWQEFRSWVLCGHTHGGQCQFPLVGAPICPVANKNYLAGFYDIAGGHKMYINRGVGHTHRVRFMSRPEITVFTLTRAAGLS